MFFKPLWEKEEKIILKKIPRLNDERLKTIYENADKYSVRMAALVHIKNCSILKEIYDATRDESLKHEIFNAISVNGSDELLIDIFNTTNNQMTKKSAFSKIGQQQKIKIIDSCRPEDYNDLCKLFDNEYSLANMIMLSNNKIIQSCLLDKINDKKVLDKILDNNINKLSNESVKRIIEKTRTNKYRYCEKCKKYTTWESVEMAMGYEDLCTECHKWLK
jgi:hypothetical protein